MGAWWQNLRLLHNSTLLFAEYLTLMLTLSYHRSSNLVLDLKTWEKGVRPNSLVWRPPCLYAFSVQNNTKLFNKLPCLGLNLRKETN